MRILQRGRGGRFYMPSGTGQAAYAAVWGSADGLHRGFDTPTTARVGTCRPMGFSPASVPEGFQRASGKPFGAPAGAYPCPGWGLVRRLWRGSRACSPRGSRQLRCPKVSKGERREAGIQWIQPPKAVSDPEFRQTTSGAHGSANRADCLPRGKPLVRPQAHTPAPGGE